MKVFIFLMAGVLSLTSLMAQIPTKTYDRALADSLGGDNYGMKPYILVMLKTGSNTVTDKAVLDSLFKGHLENINRLAAAGHLAVAGPVGKNEMGYRGLFILNVKTLEEGKALLATDPAVKAHLLDAELYQWYGSAALPMYLPFHKKIEKANPAEMKPAPQRKELRKLAWIEGNWKGMDGDKPFYEIYKLVNDSTLLITSYEWNGNDSSNTSRSYIRWTRGAYFLGDSLNWRVVSITPNEISMDPVYKASNNIVWRSISKDAWDAVLAWKGKEKVYRMKRIDHF